MLDRLNLYFDQVVSKGPRFGILLYTLTHAREKSLNFFAQATKNGQLAR